MLERWLGDNLLLFGLAQALAAAGLSLLIVTVARYLNISLFRDSVTALLRGLVQVVAVGFVLLLILQSSLWVALPVLAFMAFFAATIAARRAKGIPDVFSVSLMGIALGAGAVILVMTWLGVIDNSLAAIIPVGSMLVANAMNTSSLFFNRLLSEVEAHVGQIEAGLSLGAASSTVVAPYIQAAVEASLIPRIDSIRSLGLVWIPGVMTGLILAGDDPVYAGIYQLAVMAMIFASAALTSIITSLLVRRRLFSPAEQLLVRAKDGV
ncbi:MAG: ABC transporter permease [Chloroflexi bacterium]|nr:MAG: ABC transporter permease [Chloroflexota bacterium]MBL1196614.1 ABC transporter permease [Chloroflexota bacterium]NOH13907.1 ABC transporter permease [Chloroflexota bacterium]